MAAVVSTARRMKWQHKVLPELHEANCYIEDWKAFVSGTGAMRQGKGDTRLFMFLHFWLYLRKDDVDPLYGKAFKDACNAAWDCTFEERRLNVTAADECRDYIEQKTQTNVAFEDDTLSQNRKTTDLLDYSTDHDLSKYVENVINRSQKMHNGKKINILVENHFHQLISIREISFVQVGDPANEFEVFMQVACGRIEEGLGEFYLSYGLTEVSLSLMSEACRISKRYDQHSGEVPDWVRLDPDDNWILMSPQDHEGLLLGNTLRHPICFGSFEGQTGRLSFSLGTKKRFISVSLKEWGDNIRLGNNEKRKLLERLIALFIHKKLNKIQEEILKLSNANMDFIHE